MLGQHGSPRFGAGDRKMPEHAGQARQYLAIFGGVGIKLKDRFAAARRRQPRVARFRGAELGFGRRLIHAGVAHDRQRLDPTVVLRDSLGPTIAGHARHEKLPRVEFARHIDQTTPRITDEFADHLGPGRTHRRQVRIEQQQHVVVIEFGLVRGQTPDGSVPHLLVIGVGRLQPRRELDRLVAQQAYCAEIDIPKRGARDHQDTNLLPNHFDIGGGHVVGIG